MRFKIEDHDVTCLCALVFLPKRLIIEELPAARGAARASPLQGGDGRCGIGGT